MSQAISSRKETNAAGCLIVFFAIFAVAGLFAFTVSFLLPCINVLRAQSWTPTPCVIRSSAVASRGSGKDLRYYSDVLFEYSAGGQTYNSTRYSFFNLGFKNTYQPQGLLNAYPNGAAATCYVAPSNPGQAVLDRGFQSAALSNLLSLIFVAVGVGGIIWGVLNRRAAARNEGLGQKSWRPKNSSSSFPSVPPSVQPSTDARSTPFATSTSADQARASAPSVPPDGINGAVLKPTITPAGQGCVMLLVAVFWNGIISVFLREVIFDSSAGFFRIGIGLFLIPFIVVGAILIVAALASLGAMFIPRPQLTAGATAVPIGGQLQLKWHSRRGLLSPRKVIIWLEAREEATYTRGTDSITEKNIFFSRPIFESTVSGGLDNQANITIPADAMHSFEAPHNKILWAIKVKGDVPLWPNFEDEYRLVVLPLKGESTPVATQPLGVAPRSEVTEFEL